MKFYLDEENANKNYSYATFEESIGGRSIFINKQKIYLIVPVINQGIYDLKTFNNGSQTPLYFNKSYYFFSGIKEYTESLSIRENNDFKGEFLNNFTKKANFDNHKSFYVELEMGYNGNFIYAASWRVKAREFGVLIPDNSLQSEDESTYYKKVRGLNKDELDFLLNKRQVELEHFIEKLT